MKTSLTYLNGNVIGFDAVDDDVNGQAILTLRAIDGIKTSEATLTVNIQPENDAPRLSSLRRLSPSV